MKTEVKKEFVKTSIFIILLLILFIYTSKVLENKEAAVRSGKFYAGMTNTNVIILGTSHSLYGLDPEIMKKEGVDNVYNLSGYSQVIPTSYWVLVNALDYCSPSVVILDVYSVQNNALYPKDNLSFLHSAMDAMPITINKIHMIESLLNDRETSKEFYANIYLYHNRWREIKIKDFEVLRYYFPTYHGMENGCIRDTKSVRGLEPTIINESNKIIVDSKGMEYLEKIYDLCEVKGIQLVLIQLPYNASEYQQQVGNGIYDWAYDHNVPYYNMLNDSNIDIDYSTDYIEAEAAHLNVLGAKKTSEALSMYLINNGIIDK